MSHLKDETLARLVDDEATSLEAAHLAECEPCRTELDAMRADTHALAGLGDIAPPEHAWAALATRLGAEGLVRHTRRSTPVLLRVAAALALFLTGTLAGFSWRTATLPEAGATLAATNDNGTAPAPQPQDLAPSTAVAIVGDDGPATSRSGPPDAAPQQTERAPSPLAARTPSSERRAAAADAAPDADRSQPRIIGPAPGDARFASLPQFAPRTAQEAAVQLRNAEGAYLDALVSYSLLAGDGDEAGDPLARLAALEGIVLSTRAALGRAPADPIINGYHMTALAQREATLRQIAATTRNPWF